MYLVTIENDDGIWWDDEPASGDTKEDAIAFSQKLCKDLPEGYVRVVYSCQQVETLDT